MISICTSPTSSFGFVTIESGSILFSPLHLVAGKAAEEKVGGSGDVCNGREERREQCWDAFPLGRGGEEEEERETAKRVRKEGAREREKERQKSEQEAAHPAQGLVRVGLWPGQMGLGAGIFRTRVTQEDERTTSADTHGDELLITYHSSPMIPFLIQLFINKRQRS